MAGALFASRMPGFAHWPLDAAFHQIAEHRIGRIVCLEDEGKILDRSPAYWRALTTGGLPAPATWIPVEDYGVPHDLPAYVAEVGRVAADLRAGERILVHCAGGCGRSGTFASMVLVALGMSPDDAVGAYWGARGCGPESEAQRALVRDAVRHVRPSG